MTILTIDGKTSTQGLRDMLQRALQYIKPSKELYEPVAEETRRYVQDKYPGSKHWDPSKINATENGVAIDIPGASRAFRDLDIYPKSAEYLTIPLHRSAYGLSPREFPERLFRPKGKDILAMVQNGALVAVYALSKHVHQNQDRTLLPSDSSLTLALARSCVRQIENGVW